MLNIRKLLGNLRTKVYFSRLRLVNQNKSPKEIFTDYWRKNHWKNNESKSGDGSTLLYTEHIRHEIPLLLERLKIKSMLDAPCGDFNWFKEVNLGHSVEYLGGDIVDALVVELNQNYGRKDRVFITLDVINDNLPDVDFWLCRDLIFHLPMADVLGLIERFIDSNIKYLLITSHTASDVGNEDTFTGGFRLINLSNPPFSLPAPMEKIKDYIDGFPERYLLLYSRESLREWKKGRE